MKLFQRRSISGMVEAFDKSGATGARGSLVKRARITVRVDWYTRVCLTVIAVLLTVVIIGLWTDGVQLAPTARAVYGRDDRLTARRRTSRRTGRSA